jgi:hypothetical protein
VNAVVKLAHAFATRADLSDADRRRLAREAIAEHDRVRAENADLKRLRTVKFQGMTELA